MSVEALTGAPLRNRSDSLIFGVIVVPCVGVLRPREPHYSSGPPQKNTSTAALEFGRRLLPELVRSHRGDDEADRDARR